MKIKYKVILLVLGILLAIALATGSSYAMWVTTSTQEGVNAITSDCFEIEIEGNKAIVLINTFPMKDGQGVYETPYTFTVKNICNHGADYKVNLETLKQSTLDPSNIKVDLNGHIKTYGDGGYSSPILSDASKSYQIYEDIIGPNSSKTFNLRLWVKEDAVTSEVENKTFTSKISVSATARSKYSEATLVKGEDFNLKIKQLANSSVTSHSTNDTNITSIQRSESAPKEEDNYVDVAEQSLQTPVYAWFKDGIIYLYSEANKIFMNEDASDMFYRLKSLTNIDLSIFDTSNVKKMVSMFSGVSSMEKIDVSSFDTVNVINMRAMFAEMNSLLNIDFSSFDTSKVTDMAFMFKNLKKIQTINTNTLNTSNVNDMEGMFGYLQSLTSLDLEYFNTGKVTNMAHMFEYSSKLTYLDVSSFDTSNVTLMHSMFESLRELKDLDVRNFNTSKATNIAGLFEGMSSLTSIDVSSFDTSKVENMNDMFSRMTNLKTLDLSNFNTSNVKTMDSLFSYSTSLEYLDLSSFNTPKVEEVMSMFSNMDKLTYLDISNFDTSKFKKTQYMFSKASALKTVYVGNKWNMPSFAYSVRIFEDCTNLIGGAGTTYDSTHITAEYARIDDPDNGKPGYFTLKTN